MKEHIISALTILVEALPVSPRWVLLCNQNGELVARLGEFLNPTLNEAIVSSITREHILREIGTLENLKFGNLQFSLHIGSKGVYCIFYLNNAYILGLGYENVNVPSFDSVVESVLGNFYALLEALYDPEGL